MSRDFGVTVTDQEFLSLVVAAPLPPQPVTIATTGSAADYVRGTVLGRVKLGAATAAKVTGGTGDATIAMDGTTPILEDAKAGVYNIIMTGATAFQVFDPDGAMIGTGANGTAFARHIKFTVTTGSTPQVAGDAFTVTIAQGSGKFTAMSLTAVDGTAVPAAILAEDVSVGASADEPTSAYRKGIFRSADLTWPSGISAAQKKAAYLAMESAGLFVDLNPTAFV